MEKKRRWVEQLPSLVSTIGVFGTFVGITIGLINFDTDDIAGSIPELLSGLSTAFFTSLAGMLGSMILSRQVNALFDEEEKGISDARAAAASIVDAIGNLSRLCERQVQILTTMQSDISTMKQRDYTKNLKDIDDSLGLIGSVIPTDEIVNVNKTLTEVAKNQVVHDDVVSLGEKMAVHFKDQTGTILENVGKPVKRIDEHVGELVDIENAIHSQLEEATDRISELKDKLHSEVLEIEDSMEKTNALLSEKFNEFTELLKKSNTEALVEVMKRVTEEFQKQMGELINKLVQENFDQLNKSVERLNTWQMENKEMIASLTSQYKAMAENFEATSTTLDKVGGDTKLLVSDGGKLRQIIDALNKVMVEDTRFVEISTRLAEAASLNKDNMQKFDEATTKLNEWVKKQRNFKEAVDALIIKLDEINKINDYSDTFWKETRKGLNDAVGSIQASIRALNDEIGTIDEHFYERLSATLSELDTCMQAMINGRR